MKATLLFLLACTSAFSQNPQFQRLYGSTDNSIVGYEVIYTQDSSLIFCGGRLDTIYDAMLMKLNVNGDTLWTRYYDSGSQEVFSGVKEMANGNIVAGGSLDTLAFIACIQPDGNVLWSKAITSPGRNTLREILPMQDSGLIAVADGYPGSTVFRLSPTGNIEWQVSFYDKNYYDIIQLSDGSIMACGSRSHFPDQFGLSDIALMKMTSTGSVLWEKLIGNSFYQSANSMIQAADGNCYLTGQQNDPSGESDILLIKCDTSGTVDWIKSFNPGFQDIAIEIQQLKSEHLLINGHTINQGIGNGIIINTDLGGALQWNMTYGAQFSTGCWSVLETENGFFASGFTLVGTPGSANLRGWLGRTDTNGHTGCRESNISISESVLTYSDTAFNTPDSINIVLTDTLLALGSGQAMAAWCPTLAADEHGDDSGLMVYPNPSDGMVTIAAGSSAFKLELFDLAGAILQVNESAGTAIDLDLIPGVYLYRIISPEGRIQCGRIVTY